MGVVIKDGEPPFVPLTFKIWRKGGIDYLQDLLLTMDEQDPVKVLVMIDFIKQVDDENLMDKYYAFVKEAYYVKISEQQQYLPSQITAFHY